MKKKNRRVDFSPDNLLVSESHEHRGYKFDVDLPWEPYPDNQVDDSGQTGTYMYWYVTIEGVPMLEPSYAPVGAGDTPEERAKMKKRAIDWAKMAIDEKVDGYHPLSPEGRKRSAAKKKKNPDARWNPTKEYYSLTIKPEGHAPTGATKAEMRILAEKVLQEKRIWADFRGENLEAGTMGFDDFRDVIIALDVRGFHGTVKVRGEVSIVYPAARRHRKKVERLARRARTTGKMAREAAKAGGSTKAAVAAAREARRALARATRGT